jgi:hypothetical protein
MNSDFLSRGLVVSLIFLVGCSDMCGNEQSTNALSPKGSKRVVVFTRDCGATTSGSTQVSVLKATETLSNDAGNTLILGDKVPLRITWKSESEVVIGGVAGSTPFKQERTVSGVTITYE